MKYTDAEIQAAAVMEWIVDLGFYFDIGDDTDEEAILNHLTEMHRLRNSDLDADIAVKLGEEAYISGNWTHYNAWRGMV